MGAGGGVLGRAADGNKLVGRHLLGSAELALKCLLPAAIAPSSSDIGGSSGDQNSPSGRESIHRPTTAKGSGGRHRLLMFL